MGKHDTPSGTKASARHSTLAQYNLLRGQQLDTFEAQLPSFIDAFYWPPERLRHQREARLRRLVAVAKERSPWHAKRLAKIDPEQLTEADVTSLPIMTKSDLMAHFDEIVTDRSISLALVEEHLAGLQDDAYLLRTNHAISSGGSSGMRGAFVYDWDSWITLGLSSARPVALMLAHSAKEVRRRAVAFVGDNAAHSSLAFAQSFGPWILRQFDSFVPLSMALPFDMMVDELNELQPTCLSGYPSLLYQLCFAAADGGLRIRPGSILVGAEPLFPEQQAAFERTFGAQVFNFYGCSEASCVGFSCPAGSNFHLCDDTAILEPVSEAGAPAALGVPSHKVLVTNLFNTLLPLIRYELDDSITRRDSSDVCECGSSFQKVSGVDGRTDDTFIYDGGVFVHPFAFRSALGHEPSVIEYQVQQTRRGVNVFAKVAGAFDREALIACVVNSLRTQGLSAPEVSLDIVERIERSGIGKLRRFIPLPAKH